MIKASVQDLFKYLFICLLASAFLGSCTVYLNQQKKEGGQMTIEIKSDSFTEGSMIPQKFSCDGENISPPLTWSNVPQETKSLSLIVDDPDAPSGVFVHWVVYNIEPSSSSFPEGVPQKSNPPGLGIQGKSSYGKVGYMGPCPPKGARHRYFFRVYALDTMLSLNPGASRAELDKAMTGHILASGQLMGFFTH